MRLGQAWAVVMAGARSSALRSHSDDAPERGRAITRLRAPRSRGAHAARRDGFSATGTLSRLTVAASSADAGSSTRSAVLGLASIRAFFGVAALLAPGPAGKAWIGAGASGRDRHVLLRALGGRDLALGLGALLAARRGKDLRGWVAMGALSDLVDTLGTAVGFRALPRGRRWVVLAASAGAALVGAWLAATETPVAAGDPG